MSSVSVITSVYNEESNIREYLDSLQRQTYHDFELVIVDDGSSDRTVPIIGEYESVLSITLISMSHQGWKLAKAEGVRAASGDVLVIFDADEIIEPQCIEKLVKPFVNKKVGAVGGRIVALGDTWVVRGAGVVRMLLHRMRKTREGEAWVIAAGCMALRSAAVQAVGGLSSSDRLIGQDVDISWRLLEHGWELVSVDDALVRHRDPPTLVGLFKRQYTFGKKAVYTYWLHKGFWLNWKLWVRFYPLVLLVLLPLHPTAAVTALALTFITAIWLFKGSGGGFSDKFYGWIVLTVHCAAYAIGFVVELLQLLAKAFRSALAKL